MNRRAFLKSAVITASTAAITPTWSKSEPSSAYRLVAATDRTRILTAANAYLPDPPVTITDFSRAVRAAK
jgi:hypothetical protein